MNSHLKPLNTHLSDLKALAFHPDLGYDSYKRIFSNPKSSNSEGFFYLHQPDMIGSVVLYFHVPAVMADRLKVQNGFVSFLRFFKVVPDLSEGSGAGHYMDKYF